jgi:oligopeptidase B
MRMRWKLLMLACALCMAFVACDTSQQTALQPPVAKQESKELTIHGDVRTDPYFWLRDDTRSDEEVLDYLRAENEYTEAVMKHTEALQEKLFEEIKGRIKQDDESVPVFDNGYYYYDRTEEGKQYPIYCRKEGSLDADEEIMLDVNVLAEGHNFFSVRGLSVSTNNELLAYAVDTVGRRKYTIKFKNLATGEFLADEIPEVTGNLAWANDSKTVFYTRQDPETLRWFQVYRYELGGDSTLVYQEDDVEFSTYVFKTKSDAYIMIACDQTEMSEYRFLDANTPTGEFKLVQPRREKLEYSVDHYGDSFYIRTNLNAENFRLVKAPVASPGLENWTEVVPHREDVFLQSYEIFKDYLVLTERSNGLRQLRVISWNGDEDYYLEFDEPTYVAYVSDNPEFDTPLLRYGYSSLSTPPSTYDYNMATRKPTLLKQEEVIGYDPSLYTTERLWAPVRQDDEFDAGVRVPISLVYRNDMFKGDGSNPLFLYSYGSYGSSTEPYFRSTVVSLLDRGFVFALAHIRGGQELGREWYEEGRLLNKINTFTDFIDSAKYLVEQNYTNTDKLFAMGGSAGGLLMGAIVNMSPETFKGVIAHVPWVDVVTTMLDTDIPLTTSEFDEWGNPQDEKYYNYMLSYSPYDQVKAQEYPNMLVTTGLHDSQVQYWEPAKWVAKLRAMKTDDNLLLLKTNMEAGHGGATGRYERYRETALDYAFMLDILGMTE